MTCNTLNKSCLDHYPLLLLLSRDARAYPTSFKFMSMWNSHNDCKRLIKDVWSTDIHGCPIYRLSQKLKLLKKELKIWNKSVFGDVHLQVQKTQETLDCVQAKIDSDGCSDLLLDQQISAQFTLCKFSYSKKKSRKKRQDYLGLFKVIKTPLISIRLLSLSRFQGKCLASE